MEWGERITDMVEIEKLYHDGKISRTTYWRARKRGWCSPSWQTPKRTSSCSEKEVFDRILPLYKSFKKKAIYLYRLYGKRGDYSVCDDMAHDAILYIVKKREVKYPLTVAEFYMRHYLLKGRYETL